MVTDDIGGPVDPEGTAKRAYNAAMEPLRAAHRIWEWADLPEDSRDLWRRAATSAHREGYRQAMDDAY